MCMVHTNLGWVVLSIIINRHTSTRAPAVLVAECILLHIVENVFLHNFCIFSIFSMLLKRCVMN